MPSGPQMPGYPSHGVFHDSAGYRESIAQGVEGYAHWHNSGTYDVMQAHKHHASQSQCHVSNWNGDQQGLSPHYDTHYDGRGGGYHRDVSQRMEMSGYPPQYYEGQRQVNNIDSNAPH